MPGRKWTVDEKMNIVLEGMVPGANISEVCRQHGVAQSLYYKWRDAFLAGGRAGLQSGPSTREQELEKQLQEAMSKIGEQAMEIDVLRKKIELGPEVSSRSLVAQLVKEGFRVPVIAKALELNRTYCYSLLKEPVKKAKKAVIDKDALLKQRIRHLCERFPRYGYRRIKVMLRRQYSMQVNHKRVHRLMREMGLLVKSPQREASRKKRSGKIPVSQSNEHFQCDMTKIWCGKDGWGYLFAVIDAYDREIVGYSFSRYCRTEELLQAVDNAFNYRFPSGVRGANLTLRTDNGCQMTSRRFVQAMKDCQVKHERTGYNNPDADGYIERFFRSLKEEEVWMQEYDNFAEAKIAIKTYIEFYNKERPHSALGYRTPQEFRKWKESKEAA